MAFLPKFISLKSDTNNSYLRFIHEDIENLHGILKFSGDEVVSPYTKFQVEKAEAIDKPQLVHIRSCYNNKYWRTAGEDKSQRWIVAGADEKQESTNDSSCTLFKPEFVQEKDKISQIRLLHVQSGSYLTLFSAPENDVQFQAFLSAGQKQKDPEGYDVFNFINWENFVILPKYLAFHDDNGKYLRTQYTDGNSYLQFSVTDPTDPPVENEVFTVRNGSVRIKSTHNQNHWRRNSNRNENYDIILSDSNDKSNQNLDTLFCPFKVSNKQHDVVVTLCNMGNKLFCARSTNAYLAAFQPAVTPAAHLAVRELVLSRTINVLNFRTHDARIYNRTFRNVVATGESINPTQNPVPATILLSYKDEKESTWNNNVDDSDFTSRIKTTLTSDTLFLLDEGRIGVCGHFNKPYIWGDTHKSHTAIESPFDVIVPAMSKVTVTLFATQASCDIPFYYSQQDTLNRERTITYHKEDGLYTTGVSFYNFEHQLEVKPYPE